MSKNVYPVLKFSKAIEAYRAGKISELAPIKPKYPTKETSASSGCLKVLLIISALSALIVLPFSFYAGLFFILNGVFIGVGKVRIKREADLKWKRELRTYKANLKQYKQSLSQVADLEKRLNTASKRNNFIQKRIREIAQTIAEPSKIETEGVKKGALEDYFLTILQKIFGTDIHTNLTAQVGDVERPYVPDFVYYDSKILIDIEIDEPYVFDTHKPIHYFNPANNLHSDSKRDNFFLKQNWIVIRFSEKQILEQAYSCCKVIAEVIELTTANSKPLKNLKEKSNLKADPFWTRAEAMALSQKGYREKYLKDFEY